MLTIATGTRADWGLLRPLALRLSQLGVKTDIVATHAHLIPSLGNTVEEIIADGFSPACRIPAEGTPAEVMAMAVKGFAEYFDRAKPDCVVILGDRYEMLGVASAALLKGIRVAHIAGGTVSEGAFDDNIRNAISMIASIHFPETEECAERLAAMGINRSAIHTAGALGLTGIDPNIDPEAAPDASDLPPVKPPYLVMTLHAETATAGESLLEATERMLAALEPLLPEIGVVITYPNADVDPLPAIEALRRFAEAHPQRVYLTPSLGHRRYIAAVKGSVGVVGNSSSGIVEVPSLGVPTLDVGHRQQGRQCGPSVVHVPQADTESISHGLERILSPEMQELASRRINPYYRPDTADIIASTLVEALSPDACAPRVLALITARSGSKGIPDKNIRPLAGIPLLAHSIRHAREAGFPRCDIVLSTDSEAYAAIGREYGADVPFIRPDDLASDTAGSREVMLHAVDTLARMGRHYDTICLLQPTSPLRSPEDIREAIELYRSRRPDMVVGVTRSGANPYYNLFEADPEGYLRISKGDGGITRRQDAPPVYEFNGAVYIISVAALRKAPISQFPHTLPLVMPPERSLDLDSESDWLRASTQIS